MKNSIEQYENVLDLLELSRAQKLLNDGDWKFHGRSHGASKVRFWFMDLKNEPFFTENVFQKIKTLTGKKLTLDQCYANGQTYGQDGEFHYDGFNSSYDYKWTFLLHLTNWTLPAGLQGGQTEIQVENIAQNILSFAPTTNAAIMFPQGWLHRGVGPARDFYDLRTTVAFKMTEELELPF